MLFINNICRVNQFEGKIKFILKNIFTTVRPTFLSCLPSRDLLFQPYHVRYKTRPRLTSLFSNIPTMKIVLYISCRRARWILRTPPSNLTYTIPHNYIRSLPSAIRPGVESLPMHLTSFPLSYILPPVTPQESAFTVHQSFLEASLILVPIGPFKVPIAISFPFSVLPLISSPVHPSVHPETLL